MILTLKRVRLSFASLFEAKAVGDSGGELRFSAAFPIEPNSENHIALRDGMIATAKEKWGVKADAILKELTQKGRVCFKEFPLAKDGEVYEGFEGMFSLNASNKARPLVVDRDKTVLTKVDGRPYNGCFVVPNVELWAQDNSWGKRLNATLRWVQFAADGDAFAGGKPVSMDEFEAIAEGSSAEDMV